MSDFSRQVYRQAHRDNAHEWPATPVAVVAQATKARELSLMVLNKVKESHPLTWRYGLKQKVAAVLLDFYRTQKSTRPVYRIIKELKAEVENPRMV